MKGELMLKKYRVIHIGILVLTIEKMLRTC